MCTVPVLSKLHIRYLKSFCSSTNHMDDIIFYLSSISSWYKIFTPVHLLDTFYIPVFD